MESDTLSSPRESNVDANTNATFRKPANEAGSRKYRRRSPLGGSSSSGENPIRERVSSPPLMKKDREKATDDWKRKDGERGLERDSGRNQYGGGGNPYKYSERQSSRSSHGHHRHDDYHRQDRYADDRDYSRSSRHSDYRRKEKDHRTRDYERDYDKYSRDKPERLADKSRDREKDNLSHECEEPKNKDSSSDKVGSGLQYRSSTSENVKAEEREMYKSNLDKDEKIVSQRSLGDYKNKYSHAYEESRSHRNDPASMRDSFARQKETSGSDSKSMEEGKYSKDEKYSDAKGRYNEWHRRDSEEQFDDRGRHCSKDRDYSTKKPKIFSPKESMEDVTKEKAVSVDNLSTNPKPAQDPSVKGTSEPSGLTDADVDAAKLAAMKAAELVNRNLVGTGLMSADQKKKLLWGNKKAAPTEESGHHWDTTMLGDPERQEKFQKLMGVKGNTGKVVEKLEDHNVEKQREEQLQMDLEKQYTAGLRRRDGRTVGLGL